jgi:hypothetical protein
VDAMVFEFPRAPSTHKTATFIVAPATRASLKCIAAVTLLTNPTSATRSGFLQF